MYRAMKHAIDRRGEIKSIAEVRSGLACECICPECKKQLVANNNDAYNEHHFAHLSGVECDHGYETSLYVFAIKLLREAKRIRVPAGPTAFSFKHKNLVDVQEYKIISVQVEKYDEDYVPDIILELNNGDYLNVEIFVTHKVNLEKRAKIIRRQRDTIEIDLSQFDRDIRDEEFKQILINGTKEKSWVYYYKHEQLENIKATHAIEKAITKGGSLCELCPKRTSGFYSKSKCLVPLSDCKVCDFNVNKDNHDLANINRVFCLGHYHEIEHVFPDCLAAYFDEPSVKREYEIISNNHSIELHTVADAWRKSEKKLPMYLLNHRTNEIYRLVKKPFIELYDHMPILGEFFDGRSYKQMVLPFTDEKQWTIHSAIER